MSETKNIITKSINVFNMCVPCSCHCKHCLLNYDYKLEGIEFKRGINYAKRFKEWLKQSHPDVKFMYYFGYSMDTPYLLQSMKDLAMLNSPIASFLQFNGIKKRNRIEMKEYLLRLKNCGIQLINLTFYGLADTHNHFAEREGDYEYLLLILDCAKEINLKTEVGIAITNDNVDEIDELVEIIEKRTKNIFIFTPHCGGRGINITDKKITLTDYEMLSEKSKRYLNRNKNKTQSEWYNTKFSYERERIITLSLLPDNIDNLENEDFAHTYAKLEQMDIDFYNAIPSFKELLDKYVDLNDSRLYTKKDLYARFRRQYIFENNLKIKDIDERYSYSLRI